MTPFQIGLQNLPGAPLGLPLGIPTNTFIAPQPSTQLAPPQIPGEGLNRAVNYLADYGGCGYYRCIAPNLLLNLTQKAVILESTSMVFDERFYTSVKAIKFQRQATPQQLMFINMLKQLSAKNKTKLIYEVDDVVFAEDIPLYNRNRDAFTSKEIQDSIKQILLTMDEIIVTSEYFRDYMIEKSGNKNVSFIPNYLMKWWFDRYYNLGNLVKNYDKNKKKPIVAIFASGTHVDIVNRVNQQDDFAPVIQHIIKTKTEFNWHFYGSYPLPLKPYIDNGQMKFFPWVELTKFPEVMANSGAQLTFACLQDNNFNRCKSNIKLIEAGALGLPCVCPDMVTYKDALIKYKTGDEFIDCIKMVLKNQTVYADFCKKSRSHADNFWLDDDQNLMKHYEAYFTSFGDPSRKYLK
jgi:glycosyltransferase involved in cell wall biosynthesis